MSKSRMMALRDPKAFEALTTRQVLALHERLFGPLDRLAKRRLTERAQSHGWDRSWDDLFQVV